MESLNAAAEVKLSEHVVLDLVSVEKIINFRSVDWPDTGMAPYNNI